MSPLATQLILMAAQTALTVGQSAVADEIAEKAIPDPAARAKWIVETSKPLNLKT